MIQSLRVGLFLLCAATWATGALAQTQEVDQQTIITGHDVPRNATYVGQTRFQRLQGDIVYIDHLEGDIPMDGSPLPPLPEPEEEGSEASDVPVVYKNTSRILLTIAAAALLWILIRNRQAIFDRLSNTPRAPRSQGRAQKGPDSANPAPNADGLIARLRGMQDRRAALVLLLHAVLGDAARQNDLRLGRAETARELLRRLPQTWTHLADTRHLVMAEELVQFGGRPLPEPLFDDCLTRAEVILGVRQVRL